MHLTYLWLVTVAASCIAQGESKIQDTPTIYHNQFAVYIPDGKDVADTIAAKYGFVNAGQIGSLEGFYVFEHEHVRKRSLQASDHHHRKLNDEPQVS
uniref:Furin-like protease 2 n=1 Tax=Diabrotica virgifera virgifera TaxID=50390 RepID=A0A6P7GAF1_DIAVI